MNIVQITVLILSVSILSYLVVYVGAEQIIEPEKINELGYSKARSDDSKGFAMLAIMFGFLCLLVLLILSKRWPEVTVYFFQLIGITLTILLSLLAWKVRSDAGLGGTGFVTILNLVWGIGYGLILPIFVNENEILGILSVLRQ